jgi:hypothetical protein
MTQPIAHAPRRLRPSAGRRPTCAGGATLACSQKAPAGPGTTVRPLLVRRSSAPPMRARRPRLLLPRASSGLDLRSCSSSGAGVPRTATRALASRRRRVRDHGAVSSRRASCIPQAARPTTNNHTAGTVCGQRPRDRPARRPQLALEDLALHGDRRRPGRRPGRRRLLDRGGGAEPSAVAHRRAVRLPVVLLASFAVVETAGLGT